MVINIERDSLCFCFLMYFLSLGLLCWVNYLVGIILILLVFYLTGQIIAFQMICSSHLSLVLILFGCCLLLLNILLHNLDLAHWAVPMMQGCFWKRIFTRLLLHLHYAVMCSSCHCPSRLSTLTLWLLGDTWRHDRWQFLDLPAVFQNLHVVFVQDCLGNWGFFAKQASSESLIFALDSFRFLLAITDVQTLRLMVNAVRSLSSALAHWHRYCGPLPIRNID